MSEFKELDYVDVLGDNPDWILRFQKVIYQNDEVGFRFGWRHNGGPPNYKMNSFIQTPMLFAALAAAAKKGMIN